MKAFTQIFFFLGILLVFQACYKEPIAVSNYRDALIGTYIGLETKEGIDITNQTDTTHYSYSDSLVNHEIRSSVVDADALIFDSFELHKELETTNYYLFYDSITSSNTDQHGTNTTGGTSVRKIEFFTDKDSIVIYSNGEGGSFGPGSISHYGASTSVFRGVRKK